MNTPIAPRRHHVEWPPSTNRTTRNTGTRTIRTIVRMFAMFSNGTGLSATGVPSDGPTAARWASV
ncbi:Uncharacterised protein [Mycobacteroides abscessus subsp. abscessus]|nr:Uncharacterised protein [Mycobacteroides abscessus subsp. abscessus]